MRYAALGSYATPGALLAALDVNSALLEEEKDRLVSVLVAEQCERPSPFWASILILAFAPMLFRLRARVHGNRLPSLDLDQIVVTSFLAAISETLNADRSAARQLAQRTRRGIFRVVQRAGEESALVDLTTPDALSDLAPTEDPVAVISCGGRRMCVDELEPLLWPLLETLGVHDQDENLRLVLETVVYGDTLPAYVRRHYPDVGECGFRRLHGQLKRRRARTMIRLRQRLCALTRERSWLEGDRPEMRSA
jgi:hypothetical protein